MIFFLDKHLILGEVFEARKYLKGRKIAQQLSYLKCISGNPAAFFSRLEKGHEPEAENLKNSKYIEPSLK
jgi:hypothetical protein